MLWIAATVLLTAAPSEVLVDKHRVVYESRGSGEPVLVLVHGWTCDRSLWEPQIIAFSAKYRVIAIDLPGHGESDKPEDVTYDSKLFAKAVLGVMDSASIRQAVLIGHSMGLPVIREVYAEAPGRVRATGISRWVGFERLACGICEAA